MSGMRVKLGELLAAQRATTAMTRHNLADKTRSTSKFVERWETGDLTPSVQEWQRLRAVFPALNATPHLELFKAAAAEQLASEQHKVQVVEARENDLDAAIRLLVDSVPGLRQLTLEVDDSGSVSVSFRTREVRVVEDTGSLKVRL